MQQIEGLPAGAVVKPLAGAQQNVEGLPEGAVVKSVGSNNAGSDNGGQSLDTTQAAIGQKPQDDDPGFFHGIWESTLGPLFSDAEKNQKEMDNAPDFETKAQLAITSALKNSPPALLTKAVYGMVKGAYDQGKEAVTHLGNSASGYVDAGKSLLKGDTTTAQRQARDAGGEALQAQGHGLAAAVPVLGPMAAKAGEDIGAGKPREGLGEGVGAEMQVLLGGMLGRKATSVPPEFSEVEAAHKLTDAVNPSATEMPKFSAALTKNLQPIMEFAERNKMPLESREDLMNVANEMAKERSSIFYEKMLDPIKDDMVGLGSVPDFAGETIGEMKNVTTVQNLEKRLTQINAELNPSFNKATGQQTSAALSNESHAALTAEAAQIRSVLYKTMGKKLGVAPELVAQTRASIGELKHVGEQTEFSLNQERHAANADARQPLTINPLHKSNAKFIADEAINKVANKVRTSPDDAVSEAFQHMKKDRSGVASIGEIMADKKSRNANIKATNERTGKLNQVMDQRQVARAAKHGNTAAESKPIGAAETDAEKAARIAENDQRVAKNRQDTQARRDAAAAEQKAEQERQQRNRESHGKQWKNASKGLGQSDEE